MIHLDDLNRTDVSDLRTLLHGVFEHAPWIPVAAAAQRPFTTVTALHEAMMYTVRMASPEQRLRFLKGHPELAAGVLDPSLTPESRSEQGSAALDRVQDAAELPALNHRYLDRFGFPFIVCVRRRTAEDVMRSLRARLLGEPEAEMEAALREIGHVSRLRLVERVTGNSVPRTTGSLSLLTFKEADGTPLEGLRFTLLREGRPMGEWCSGADGSAGRPLLDDGPLLLGNYELRLLAEEGSGLHGSPRLSGMVSVPFRVDVAEEDLRMLLRVDPSGRVVHDLC